MGNIVSVYGLGDSTAGIGTVTYYDENNQAFASLGHAIADADTNTNLLLKEGEIVPAEIVGVQKGGGGNPGRVVGYTDYRFWRSRKDRKQYRNMGCMAKSYQAMGSSAYPSGIQVGWQDEVQTGPAQLLCTLDGGGGRGV